MAVAFLAATLIPATATADKTWKVGDACEVQWKGTWYKSKVLEIKDGKYKIHYEGWDKKWDEWVTTKRMRVATAWKVGDLCEVKWKGKWYKSKIIEVKGPKYKIHYEGWGKEWDEWITTKRMRALVKK